MSSETVLIIGTGQAGVQTAASLRQGGFSGRITMVGDEAALPYQRPPLSKDYLKGDMAQARLYLKPAVWYTDQDIDIQTGLPITAVDVVKNFATKSDDERLDFDHLVFAAGSRNRQLPLAGAELKNIFGLRSLRDVDYLRPHVGMGKELVIIGAGYIGLETAAVARELGANVTVIELADRVLARVTSPVISDFYENLHRSHGIDIRTETSVSQINGKDGAVNSVTLLSGEVLPCDALLVGIGIMPNIELASKAGISCGDGIIVDDNARTNVDHVYAAGDCAERTIFPYSQSGRLESVHNAIEQGKQVATAILGKPSPKCDCPWFWSDQYDVKLQIAGLSTGYDEQVIRGSIEDKKFSVFYFKNKKLIAADAINSPPEFMIAKRLILAGSILDPQEFGACDRSLKELVSN